MLKNPDLLGVLIAGIYPLFGAAIAVTVRLFRTVTVLKVYTRQICERFEIPCGKDLD